MKYIFTSIAKVNAVPGRRSPGGRWSRGRWAAAVNYPGPLAWMRA